jgi:pyrimidine operon attenuation protein/uracil phosphoribosyltransferase
MKKKYILSQETAMMKMRRMAFEIMENNKGQKHIILAGIRDNGTVIAQQIKKFLKDDFSFEATLIDVNLNKKNPMECVVNHASMVKGNVLIIIDDVVNSGKTLLYAMTPFLEHEPNKMQTLTLVERSYKVFPVHVDYVGVSLSTSLNEHIQVEVEEERILGAYVE